MSQLEQLDSEIKTAYDRWQDLWKQRNQISLDKIGLKKDAYYCITVADDPIYIYVCDIMPDLNNRKVEIWGSAIKFNTSEYSDLTYYIFDEYYNITVLWQDLDKIKEISKEEFKEQFDQMCKEMNEEFESFISEE